MKAAIGAVGLVAAIFACAAQAQGDCGYAKLSGKEFVFRERVAPSDDATYNEWTQQRAATAQPLPYARYVGKRGKLSETRSEGRFGLLWYAAVLEDCERVYAKAGSKVRPRSVAQIETQAGVYFTDTLRSAESLVGHKLWVNLDGAKSRIAWYGEGPESPQTLNHLEPLHVISVQAQLVEQLPPAALYLLARRQNGEQGYVAFNEEAFFKSNPIDAAWDPELINLIKQRKLKPFTTDGCSMFPDRAAIGKADWCRCCLLHDLAYWRGGTAEERSKADRDLKSCVAQVTGSAALADMMFAGVRTGGGPYFYTPYRWGYGWPYGRGYKPLTAEESKIAALLERSYEAKNPALVCENK